jgi:ABC-type dipeptide/oligopeptide/nickel transport system permease subunit
VSALRHAVRQVRVASGVWGVLLAIVVVGAIIGPLLAAHPPDESLTAPFMPRDGEFPLGADVIGRDVLSRVLYGGRSVLLMATIANLLCYFVAVPLGLLSGYLGGRTDSVIMRILDVVLAFPPVLLLLVLASTRGTGASTVVPAVALAQAPMVARLVRSAAIEASLHGYVEAERTRGESTASILRRDILPAVAGPLAADVGVRTVLSILFIASANFLGIGLQPPASDWGLMIAENRSGLEANPLAVIVPVGCIAVLTICISLIADRIARRVVRRRGDDTVEAEHRPGGVSALRRRFRPSAAA